MKIVRTATTFADILESQHNTGSLSMKYFQLIIVLLALIPLQLRAQALTKAQANDTIKTMPSFTIYKDNYFISGVPTHTGISKHTADAKYQISFKQLLTRNTLPLDTYLFLTYTQKAFWNVYETSSPFKEINFNPTIGLGKPIYNKNNRLTGLAELKFEHESNGRDSIYSRSWNHITLAYTTALGQKTLLSLEAWYPFRYKEDNPDLMEYLGYGQINLKYDLKPEQLLLDVSLRKGLNWTWKGAVRTRLFYKISKNTNQYLMLEWFAGYAESLISYQDYRSMIRVGYVIKSSDLNFLKPIHRQL
ncbi:MAG: phospholipase A [Salegentibacter sp.]